MRVSFLIVALLTSYATAFPELGCQVHGGGNQTNDANDANFFSGGALNMADHPFVPPTDTDSRTPCPALNALANHGFLPHDGKAITPDSIQQNIISVYGFSWALATASVEGGWQACGKFIAGKKAPTDLHEFAQHNKIEHDVSLAHADTAPGEKYAPVTTDQGLLQDLISRSADGQFLTMEDLSRVRVEREDAAPVPLTLSQQNTGRAASTLLLSRFGDNEKVPVSDVQTFLGESRIPDNYTVPKIPAGFVNIGALITKMAIMMADIRNDSS